MRYVLALIVALAAGGCAVGGKHQYHDITPELKYPVRGKVAVAVQDQRKDVVSGTRPESYVGWSRGGYGNPFDVTTESGQPLAKEFQTSIAAALTRAGAQVVRVDVRPAAAPAEARKQLAATGADKAVLLVLRDWHVDTYFNVNLDHDVSLTVLGRRGQVLATKELTGSDRIGTGLVDPYAVARESVPPAYRRKLEQLLADPAVVAALR